jgi:thioredoxin-related protein
MAHSHIKEQRSMLKKISYAFITILLLIPSVTSAAEWGGVTEALRSAAEKNKPVIIKFQSDNCKACDRLNDETLCDPAVRALLGSFETAVVDVYDDQTVVLYQNNEYTSRELTKYFKIKARPTSLFLRSDGSVIDVVRGFIPKQTYIKILQNIIDQNATGSTK